MGGCLGCDDPPDREILAEYNPLILGDTVASSKNSIYMVNSMYSERMMTCADTLLQPEMQNMSRTRIISEFLPLPRDIEKNDGYF